MLCLSPPAASYPLTGSFRISLKIPFILYYVKLERKVEIHKNGEFVKQLPNESMGDISFKEIYSALVQMVTNAESITWNRFYNFLMGNSILVLAWATLFVSQANRPLEGYVMLAICIFGGASGPFWAWLGERGRNFLNAYVDQAIIIEDKWPESFNELKIFTKSKHMRDNLPRKMAGSYYLLKFIPWGFSILYLVMFMATIYRWVDC
jgi:hypothetical protein